MKGKRYTTWLLLLSVIIIWGSILYKALWKEEKPISFYTQVIPVPDKPIKKRFQYVLLANYRDPFSQTSSTDHSSEIDLTAKVIPVKWPSIQYIGCISGKTGVKISLMYEGINLLLRQGEPFGDNCRVGTISRDSVLIFCKNEKKWIRQ